MAMIPVGSDGEPRPDLLVKRRIRIPDIAGDPRNKWDIPYHR
jgi:hypothetical protein